MRKDIQTVIEHEKAALGDKNSSKRLSFDQFIQSLRQISNIVMAERAA